MILCQFTDEVLHHTFAEKDPVREGGQEVHFPARNFFFAPGKMEEVSEQAGQHLLHHLGPRGLVRYRLDDPDASLETLKGVSRREWARYLGEVMDRWRTENGTLLAQGRPPLVATPYIARVNRFLKKLATESIQPESATVEPLDPELTPSVLSDAQQMLANARNSQAVDAQLGPVGGQAPPAAQ